MPAGNRLKLSSPRSRDMMPVPIRNSWDFLECANANGDVSPPTSFPRLPYGALTPKTHTLRVLFGGLAARPSTDRWDQIVSVEVGDLAAVFAPIWWLRIAPVPPNPVILGRFDTIKTPLHPWWFRSAGQVFGEISGVCTAFNPPLRHRLRSLMPAAWVCRVPPISLTRRPGALRRAFSRHVTSCVSGRVGEQRGTTPFEAAAAAVSRLVAHGLALRSGSCGKSRSRLPDGTLKRQNIFHFLPVSLPTTVARSRSANGTCYLLIDASVSAASSGSAVNV